MAQYFPSHEPWVVPEPMTLEPAETVSRADLDAYAEIIAPRGRGGLRRSGAGAHVTALLAAHYLDPAPMDDPARWALTWRAWQRKHGAADG